MAYPSSDEQSQRATDRTGDHLTEEAVPQRGNTAAGTRTPPHWLNEFPTASVRLTDPPTSWPLSPFAGTTVLVVEDEDSNRVLIEKILTLVGYRCVSATNGLEALEVFQREKPQLVLTDISMPMMDGYEEIARLRALPGGACVPIVVVTAHAMTGDREYALREGCSEYLVKPYRPRDVVEAVERLLKEASV